MEEQRSGQRAERRSTVMTLEEVARYLRINKSTVYRMARDGTLPALRFSVTSPGSRCRPGPSPSR